MPLSVFDLYKIGIGPSSSHTVGPMWAAHRFLLSLDSQNLLQKVARVKVLLYGSLALTGLGHATDKAVILGLAGEVPDEIDPDRADQRLSDIRQAQSLALMRQYRIDFIEEDDLIFRSSEIMVQHPNGMRFLAFDEAKERLLEKIYFSVGGGFVLSEEETAPDYKSNQSNITVPHPFSSAAELLELCKSENLTIAELVRRNEEVMHTSDEIDRGLTRIREVMESCIERGCRESGELPGGLRVKRRAKKLHTELSSRCNDALGDSLTVMDWVNLYALAVNEENAAGGRVVTAPTNGAAGVIPAVLSYYLHFVPSASDEGAKQFLLTAAAIGMLYKENASISAAEVGCQGEVGVACSMAAGALCAVLGGTNEQVENAAEIGMEHNLGLTCDPIGGLVQIPCIERNTMGAIKAINAARLALRGDGTHFVSLDRVIDTMRETGRDMSDKYKETSLGGLAVNIVAC